MRAIDHICDLLRELGVETAVLEEHRGAWSLRAPVAQPVVQASAFLTYLHVSGVIDAETYASLLGAAETDLSASGERDPMIGQRFGGFVAGPLIGQGGMGRVYEARRPDGGSAPFVIKVFSSVDPEALQRFHREGRLMAELQHPNIVRVLEAGGEGSLAYLILERVDGPSLQALLERRKRFTWEGATRALRQIATALQAVHEQGMVHRDIKPHNVLLSSDGTLKLCDFGIAKSEHADSTSTHAGAIVGSPAYIAPEQWGDHSVDHRADLFSLGVLYYTLLAGVTPFHGRTVAEYAIRIQAGEYPPLERLTQPPPMNVCRLVAQLLERDRTFRTPSAALLIDDLNRLLRGTPPNLPRLECKGLAPGDSFPLLSRADLTLGSSPHTDFTVDAPGVAPTHLLLRRTPTGVILTAMDPNAPVLLNNVELRREVVLKDHDRIQLGSTALVFRAGNLSKKPTRDSSRSGSFTQVPPEEATRSELALVSVPGVLLAALEDMAHPVSLLTCIESLDPEEGLRAIRASGDELVLCGMSELQAANVLEQAERLWQLRCDWIADQLFVVTHENLGRDLNAWLAWWLKARGRYEPQVCGPDGRAVGSLQIEVPDAPPRSVPLSGEESWVLGRSLQTQISVKDGSISRYHVRILRLIQRYAFQDLGSRLGVSVHGMRQDLGLLRADVPLDLGRVRLSFTSRAPRRGSTGEVDRAVFAALVELSAPLVTESLVAMLDSRRHRREAQSALTQLGLLHDSGFAPFLEAQKKLAAATLPKLTGADLGDDHAAWSAWLREHRDGLPRQVQPRGWRLF
ncbi:MAG: protein kinase [Planctomycetes bacterium]|nr:protein kinase [Planctomycetota bacterium]